MKKDIINNFFLEKNIINEIKILLMNKKNKEEIKKSINDKKFLTIGEYFLYSSFGINIEGNFIISNKNYIGFFDEILYFTKYFNIFKKLNTDFEKYIQEYYMLYKENFKYIIYFYIFFKVKNFLKKYNGNKYKKNFLNRKELFINEDDFLFLELSNIISKYNNLIINFFYKNKNFNLKIKDFLKSIKLGNKNIEINIIDCSYDNIFFNNLESFNKNINTITIIDKELFDKYNIFFKNIDNIFIIKS